MYGNRYERNWADAYGRKRYHREGARDHGVRNRSNAFAIAIGSFLAARRLYLASLIFAHPATRSVSFLPCICHSVQLHASRTACGAQTLLFRGKMTPRAFYYRVPCALGLSAFPLSHFLLTFLFRILLLTSTFSQTSDARSDFRTRDFQALSEDDVRTLVELEPPQWTSVSEGHLGKILIPRVCTLLSQRLLVTRLTKPVI